MDQFNGGRGSGQAPAKDFLALTHGQEWVNFYESFDKLVQDHLSRSSELLRRAMSLPEVADREVQQVRTELEGRLAAERSQNFDLLTQLHGEITASHTHVAVLVDRVNEIASSLSSLSTRVSSALASLEGSATAPAAPTEIAQPEIETSLPPAAIVNGYADPIEDTSAFAAAFNEPAAVSDPEPMAMETADVAAEPEVEAMPEPWDAMPVTMASTQLDSHDDAPAATAETEAIDETPDARFDPETGLDLSAMAEAETEQDAAPTENDLAASADEIPGTGVLEGDAVGVGADRPRPHWLSVTRIGTRP